MAWAHDKDWSSTATGTITLTTPAGGVASGNLVVLFINNRNGLPTGVTDSIGGNTWTLVDSNVTQSNFCIYYSVLASTLTASSTITITLGSGFGEAVASSFSGIASASTVRDHANGSDTLQTTHSLSTSAGLAQANDLVVMGSGAKATLTFAAGTGYTLGGSVSNSTSTVGGEYGNAGSSGNQTATMTSASGSASMVIAVFTPSGGGANKAITPAAINATSAVTAAVQAIHQIAGSITATSAVTATVQAIHQIVAASINATSAVTASVSRIGLKAIAPAAIAANSAVTASIQALHQISGAVINATSNVTAAVTGPVQPALQFINRVIRWHRHR